MDDFLPENERVDRLERAMLEAARADKAPQEVKQKALANLGLLALAPPPPTFGKKKTLGRFAAGLPAKAAFALLLAGAAYAATNLPPFAELKGSSNKARETRFTERGVRPARNGSGGTRPGDSDSPPPLASAPARETAAFQSPLPAREKEESTEPRLTKRDTKSQSAQALPSIRDEIDRLDRARRSVRRGDRRRALDELRDYLARYPNGAFRDEARALESRALDIETRE